VLTHIRFEILKVNKKFLGTWHNGWESEMSKNLGEWIYSKEHLHPPLSTNDHGEGMITCSLASRMTF
jgi:hypothetical protein